MARRRHFCGLSRGYGKYGFQGFETVIWGEIWVVMGRGFGFEKGEDSGCLRGGNVNEGIGDGIEGTCGW